jgi:EmrB/QacA subfamily drug resistance transporter
MKSRWRLLVLLCLAQLMVILDISAVNVALPDVIKDLGLSRGELSWTITGYSLVFGSLLLFGGRAADLIGRRRVFLTGLGLFVLASLGSALAQTPAELFVARGGQGLGAALLSPAALSIITSEFEPGSERTRALGVWGAVGGAGAAIGVLLGGLLTQLIDWRAIFLINLPIGALVLAGAIGMIPADAVRARGNRLDVRGALIATASVGALVFAISQAQSAGWTSAQTLVIGGAGIAGLAAFAFVERSTSLPLLKIERLADRAIGGGFVMMLAGAAVLFGSFLLSSLYLQQVLGASPLATGAAFLPFAVVIAGGVHAATHIIERRGVRLPLAIGFGLVAIGMFVLTGISSNGTYLGDLLPGMLIAGAGLGLVLVSVAVSVLAGAGEQESGMLSGLNTTGHEIGGSIGLAVLATIAATGSGAVAHPSAAAITGGLSDAFLAAGIIASVAGVAALAILPAARAFLPRMAVAQPQSIH